MDASHPTDEQLSAYGLGKLDDASASAVVGHLEGCVACRNRFAESSSDTFLERVRDARQGAAPSLTGAAPAAVARKASAPAADTIPPGLADNPDYEVKKELGRGGMGVVYLAHNTLMGRDEVLKVMSKHLMDRPGVLERFLREIRAVAKLRHQNIVTAYAASRIGDSIVLAMEYVDGLDLSKMVEAKGTLPVAHACHFVYQAALGLQHAHEEGLVHRDIKPANLMLSRNGDKATVKLLDFGLAKVAREQKVDTTLTSAGQMLGTPDFIAPEQIVDAQNADIRADIYSLGGTLFYLLTGRAPFKANSLYDLYQAHISREIDPVNILRPEVPAELAALVGKMMAKEPKRRFQTPDEVARALAPFFKKGSATRLSAPLPPFSVVGPPEAAAPVPITAAPTAVSPVPTARASVIPAEPRWQNLVDVQALATPVAPAPSEPARAGSRPRRFAGVAVAALFLGLVPVLAGATLVLKHRGVEIRIKNLPDGATVQVDEIDRVPEKKGEETWLSLASGTHRIAISLSEKPPFGQTVTVDWGSATPPVITYNRPAATDGTPAKGGRTAISPEKAPRSATRERESAGANREDAGFVSLCTGSDLSAWEADVNGKLVGAEVVATATDGEIRFRGNERWVHPVTRRTYRDFVLRLEYQFPHGVESNDWSGIALFSDSAMRPSDAHANDLRVAPGQTGDFYSSGQSRPPGVNSGDRWTPTGRKIKNAELPAGQWNHVQVRCEGTSLTFELNGQVVNEVQTRAPISVWIGLRNWSSRVRFRDIRIKERKPSS